MLAVEERHGPGILLLDLIYYDRGEYTFPLGESYQTAI
jgi:hypothetical protein